MSTTITPHFDPTWRDDVFDVRAVEMPLAFPDATPRNDRLWIETRPVREETIFGHRQTYRPYRFVTAVLKPSEMSRYYTFVAKDGHGNILPPDNALSSYIFPPKAWMTDNGEERCSMFAVAQLVRGHVLVGGLGLAVYPQFAFDLHCPVESLTIVERDPEIIRLVLPAWFEQRPEHARLVKVVEGTIEGYLAETDKVFDTIYLDTWEDADSRFLAHINHLIALASQRCAADGRIQCWSYARVVETFVNDTKMLTEKKFPWHDYHLDPALQAYVDWLDAQSETPSESVIVETARRYALTVCQSIETYDRHHCLTGFGRSLVEAHTNMALSRKTEPK